MVNILLPYLRFTNNKDYFLKSLECTFLFSFPRNLCQPLLLQLHSIWYIYFVLITLGSKERQHSLTVQLAVLPPGPSGFPCSSQFFLDSSFVKLRGKYSLHVKCLLTMITDPMLTLLQLNKNH